MSDGIARARQDLAAAQLLVDNGFSAQAISRAYYAAFYAAEAALLVLRVSRSKHSGVVSAFGELVVVKGGVDPEAGRLLRRLFNHRGEADCSFGPVSESRGRDALNDATRFVDAVESWLNDGR